jgi:hypothetical protein
MIAVITRWMCQRPGFSRLSIGAIAAGVQGLATKKAGEAKR